MVTRNDIDVWHGAHIFPYALGNTQQKATIDLWKVLDMFRGRERKEKLQQLIFGDANTIIPASKTLINSF